jgi:hypothetical protein
MMLPTANVIDKLPCTFGEIDASFCSVGNPIVFVTAQSMGISGNEGVATLNANKDLLGKVREVHGRMKQMWGKIKDWNTTDQVGFPMVALLSKSTSKEGQIQSRLFLDGHCHPSMAGTGACCTTACGRIEGSVVNKLLEPAALEVENFAVQHPAGHLPVQVKSKPGPKFHRFETLGFVRTSRYIMQGQVFVPEHLREEWDAFQQQNGEESGAPSSAVNGKINGQTIGHSTSEKGATEQFVQFIHETTINDLDDVALRKLRQYLLDFIGVAELGTSVADSSAVFIKGVQALTDGMTGTTTVLGTQQKYPRQYAALLNGAFAHSLDFDDTHSGGVFHPGASVITAALAEAESQPALKYEDLLVAIAVGYEVAVRIAVAIGLSSWSRGFHK